MTSPPLKAPLRIAAYAAIAAAACVLNQFRAAYAVEIHGWLRDHAPALQFPYLFIEAVPGAIFFYCCWRIWIAVREIRRARGQTAVAAGTIPRG